MAIRLGVGSRIPIPTTGMGRAYLAALPESERGDLLPGIAPVMVTIGPRSKPMPGGDRHGPGARLALNEGNWISEAPRPGRRSGRPGPPGLWDQCRRTALDHHAGTAGKRSGPAIAGRSAADRTCRARILYRPSPRPIWNSRSHVRWHSADGGRVPAEEVVGAGDSLGQRRRGSRRSACASGTVSKPSTGDSRSVGAMIWARARPRVSQR